MSRLFFVLVGICVLLSACGSNQGIENKDEQIVHEDGYFEKIEDEADTIDNVQNVEETNNKDEDTYDFPDEIKLPFSLIERTTLKKANEPNRWEFIGQMSLGDIDGEKVTLHVYQETDLNQLCGTSYEYAALLEFAGSKYFINDCLPQVEIDELMVEVFPHIFLSEDGNLQLHAAVEVMGNTSGRMLYFLYDKENAAWHTFSAWGTPVLLDLDHSGEQELVLQFEGGGMQFPDVSILRWNQGALETVNLKRALNIEQNFNEVTIITDGDAPYFNVIAKIDPSDEEAIIQVAYQYEQGKLIKIH